MTRTAAEFYNRGGVEMDPGSGPDPETNAPTAVFLLSDLAAAVNGQVVRIERDQLAVVAHPVIREPILMGDWTVANIEAAFRGPLGDDLVPVGMAPVVRAEYLPRATALWDGSPR
jgi:hypothetical protein